ncbi:MAG: hypothetical protein J6M62_02605 [Selenomonadaceae bacterium]|nr:hypothetical protein [Selenomonadaceae bacterium]MBP3723817.1 hypothetical protein [Selenomonadaceae bacterium]
MPNDRIRQKMKATEKNLRDIIRERNEAMAAYVIALCSIKKISGLPPKDFEKLKKKYKKMAEEYAAEHQDDILQRTWRV